MESVGGFLRTRLALTVARYFPSSVRSIVHDGPYLPEDQEVVEDLRGTEVVLNKPSPNARQTRLLVQVPAAAESISGHASAAQTATPLDRDERLDASRVMQFSRNLLFSGSYLSLEHRVQNLLAYLDAAARGDGELMLRIDKG